MKIKNDKLEFERAVDRDFVNKSRLEISFSRSLEIDF